MRKLIIILLILLTLALPALAEEAAEPLFPAKGENGKWGYINARAEWVIAAQYTEAGYFRGDYACCWMAPEDLSIEEQELYIGTQDCGGIIDRTGAWVVPPEYTIESGYGDGFYGGWDEGIWIVFGYTDPEADEWAEGFFDIPSGYFSGLRWASVGHWCSEDSRLIPVVDQETCLDGYADRSTGEIIIPYRYGYSADPAQFHEGVAVVYECISLDPENLDDPVFTEWPILINEQGNVISLPESIHPLDSAIASEGLIAVTDEQGLYGYADLSGRIVIEPQFFYADEFSEGLAMVMLEDVDNRLTDNAGKAGFIDRDGNVVLRGYNWPWKDFHNGYAWVSIGEEQFCIDRNGSTVPGAYMENGLAWVSETNERGRRTGWSHLIGRDGRQIGPSWQLWDATSTEFDEGRQPVSNGNDMCYLDDHGEVILPGPYKHAESFCNGLALVRIGDRAGYIDHEGNEIFFWDCE